MVGAFFVLEKSGLFYAHFYGRNFQGSKKEMNIVE